MGVDDLRSAHLQEATDFPSLLQVSASGDQDGRHRHPFFPQGPKDRMLVGVRVNDRRNTHIRSPPMEPEGEPEKDAFRPPQPDRPWSGDVDDLQGVPPGRRSTVFALSWLSGPCGLYGP